MGLLFMFRIDAHQLCHFAMLMNVCTCSFVCHLLFFYVHAEMGESYLQIAAAST